MEIEIGMWVSTKAFILRTKIKYAQKDDKM